MSQTMVEPAKVSRMVEHNWRYLLFLLASHHPKEKLDHTIPISFRGKQVYFCSRCTGVAFGMAAVFLTYIFGLSLPVVLYFPVIGVLPLVAVIDWFTQSANLRKSSTTLRVGSGALLGISEALCILFLFQGLFLSFLVALGVVGIYALSIYVIALKTRCLDAYLKEMNQM